jgi:hypothetical protein
MLTHRFGAQALEKNVFVEHYRANTMTYQGKLKAFLVCAIIFRKGMHSSTRLGNFLIAKL